MPKKVDNYWKENLGYSLINTKDRSQEFHSPNYPEIVNEAQKILDQNGVKSTKLDDNTLRVDSLEYGKMTAYQAAAAAARNNNINVQSSSQHHGNTFQITLKIIGGCLAIIAVIAAIGMAIY